jgi:hypothetical protein
MPRAPMRTTVAMNATTTIAKRFPFSFSLKVRRPA